MVAAVVEVAGVDAVITRWLAFYAVVAGNLCWVYPCYWVCIVSLSLHSASIQLGFGGFGDFGSYWH